MRAGNTEFSWSGLYYKSSIYDLYIYIIQYYLSYSTIVLYIRDIEGVGAIHDII